jgi:dihydroflavonol-4-reductase
LRVIFNEKLLLKNKKTISITGGTGHLGINIIKALLNQEYLVKALIRHTSFPLVHPNLTWIKGDLNNLKALSILTDKSDVIIHCASAISLGEMAHDSIYEVNVTGTQNLLKVSLNKAIRFIYISSSTATEDPLKNEIFDENRSYRSDKTFFYAWTKAQGELQVLERVKKNNLDAIIIRPTAIVGPEDPGPSRFGRTILDLHRGRLPFITDGGYNMVDVRDLSQTIINSITKGKKGSVYLTGGQYISLHELATRSCQTKIPPVLPLNLLINLLPVIKLYNKFFKLRWPINKESLTTLKYAPKKMDCSKAIKELDHTNRATQNSVEDLIQWFNENKMT